MTTPCVWRLPGADVQPSAAVVSNGALFELHLGTPRTFPDAQEACQARGGNLASPSVGRDLEVLRTFLHRCVAVRWGYLFYRTSSETP